MILSTRCTVYILFSDCWTLIIMLWQSTLIVCLWYFYFRNKGLVPIIRKDYIYPKPKFTRSKRWTPVKLTLIESLMFLKSPLSFSGSANLRVTENLLLPSDFIFSAVNGPQDFSEKTFTWNWPRCEFLILGGGGGIEVAFLLLTQRPRV